MSKLDPKFRRCIFIGYGIDVYNYGSGIPRTRKIFRHKDVIFNEKNTYKDLQMEMSTSENNLRVAPQSTLTQQSAADSEFVKLKDAPMDKARNIPEGIVESRVPPLTPPQTEL